MELNYSSTKAPTVGSNSGPGYPPNASWSNPSNITADDGSSATIGFFEGGQDGDTLVGSSFEFQQLPPEAVIDGIQVNIEGSNTGCYGGITISIGAAEYKDVGALNGSFGSSTDLWGLDFIDPADIDTIDCSIFLSDVSGGDGVASVEYMTITVFWHIEVESIPSDVPTRIAYKVYSREGNYLGELPNVSSKFGFSQDINSAGSSIQITCGQLADNVATVGPLLTESDEIITTESDLPIMATTTDIILARGNSDDAAIFKNSNRVKVWIYNQWYPNGKLMFSGQINRVAFQHGGGNSSVQLTVYSDGLDLDNFIARGYPFTYTTDVSQTTTVGAFPVTFYSYGGWDTFGQTFTTGPAVTNVGAIVLRLQGTATVTVSLYDAPNGNLLGSVTKAVSAGTATDIQFEFSQLIEVSSSTQYFFAIWLPKGQVINMYRQTSDVYAGGSRYRSQYAGGSGGGSFVVLTGELYFITKSGTPTTTTTYSTDDPVTEMMTGILLDYNARGGYITERDFIAAGYTLTYTFNSATIYDALRKVIEMSPTGYYAYIDLGTAEIDIAPTSAGPDFTIVCGKDINQLTIAMSIEQVKNYLLLSGGDTGGGVNLFRQYQDATSTANYGIRMGAKGDNRVTLSATADAIGNTFIEENSEETQETTVTVLNSAIDITLLTPGKTIGFKNFGNFIDEMVLQIVRRDFTPHAVNLTLGRLPVTMTAQIQRINKGLLFEQTIKNPTAPS